MHYYITINILALDSKELEINTKGYFIGNNGVHNMNSRIIVFINWNGTVPGKTKLLNHINQEPISLDNSYSSNYICFCGTQSIYILRLRSVKNCTSRNVESNPVVNLILVGSVLYVVSTKHIRYPISIYCLVLGQPPPYNHMVFGFWKIQSGSSPFSTNTPVYVNT